MSSVLSGVKIAVLGGDDRELVLITELVKMGATVGVVGFPRDKVAHGAFVINTVEEACKDAEVVILPMPGTNSEGVIRAVYSIDNLYLTEQAIRQLSSEAIVIIGSARPFLKKWSEEINFTLLEIAEIDEVAILNSIPTAEGAIQIAMEESRITIHGSNSCVIGFGRVGITMARTLKSLGSDVTVAARSPGQLARAYEMGCKQGDLHQLSELLTRTDFVYNTIPSMILTKDVLTHANPDILIIDLATQPGGTDFEAANQLGLKAILAPGLPGKVAPVYAGKILAQVIPRLIIDELGKSEKSMLFG
ncbi:MAG: dipicolinate synthase subunit DpsA [Syntrophomonadaceae bacterium]|jgi:dipicolinate synthase subunit A